MLTLTAMRTNILPYSRCYLLIDQPTEFHSLHSK